MIQGNILRMWEMNTASASSNNIGRAAYATFGLALLVPFIAGEVGALPAGAAVYFGGRAICAMVIGWVGAEVIFHKAPERRVHARLAVGVGLLIWACVFTSGAGKRDKAAPAYRDTAQGAVGAGQAAKEYASAPRAATPSERVAPGDPDDERTAAFLQQADKMQADLLARASMLNEKFKALDLEEALAPASLTNATKLAASRAMIDRFAELIQERRDMYDNYMISAEHFMKTANISEKDREVVLAEFTRRRERSAGTFGELESAQSRLRDVVVRLLDYAKSRLGTIKAVNGSLEFSHQADAGQYDSLISELEVHAKAEARASRALAEEQRANAQYMADTSGRR
jgi:hypothetical protein